MSDLQIFKNNQFGEVRVIITKTGEPLFCLPDLRRILDLQTKKVKERLNKDGGNTIPVIDSIGRTQETTLVNEANFYKAVFQSHKPEAETFIEWVTSEVLPSIRQYGAYMTPATIEKFLADPNTIIQIAQTVIEERSKRQVLQEQTQ
jgi:anti-repressor protein